METPATGVMFVCLGNICRSPLAEAVFSSALRERGLDRQFFCASRGTAAFNTGKPADPRAIAVAGAHGYSLEAHRARQIRDDDFLRFDYLVAMDRANLETLRGWLPPAFAGRVDLLMGFTRTGGEVGDPYYLADSAFADTLRMIERGVYGLLEHLLAGRVQPHPRDGH